MKSFVISFIFLFSFIYPQDITNIAVLELEADGISESDARILTNKLRRELIGTAKFKVIERGAMEDILKEQGFQQTGCTSDACVVEAGQLIGVNRIVAGSVGKIGNLYVISVRLINVEKGDVLKSVGEELSGEIEDVLKSGIKIVAQKLAGLIDEETDVSFDISTSKEKHLLKKSRAEVTLKSLIIPGWGESSVENNKGWIILGAEVLGIAASILFAPNLYYFQEGELIDYNIGAGPWGEQVPKIIEFESEDELLRYWYREIIEGESWGPLNTYEDFKSINADKVKSRKQYLNAILISSVIAGPILSVIYANLSLNKYNRKYQLSLVPDFENNGIKLCLRF